MIKKLFEGSDESGGEDFQLNTNKDYANSYNQLRKKELLQKFKDRGLDVSETESSSESESSGEEEVLDPSFDQEFFKTLASLKSKDPSIYDKSTRFFEEVDQSDRDTGPLKKEKKSRPVTLKDYERQIILEKGGKFEEDDYGDGQTQTRAASPTLAEEERRLKEEFKQVIDEDNSEEEEFGGIFKKREKTKAEKDKEEEDYVQWLAGKKDTIEENIKEKLEPLKAYWSSNKLPQSERFLRDYILNQGYKDASNYNEIPTYDEIVGDNAPLSEDEQELEKQAEFEQKYNFRFEEPDSEFIKRYPRTIESSVRRTDDKRKQKRQELRVRKQKEKEQKMRELEMVKEMKRKEIEEKIRKLKAVTGNEELGFKEDELEGDFDPEAHDRRMQEIFNDEYYQMEEGEEKPECPSDIEELKIEDWDNYDSQIKNDGCADDYEPHCEDEDFNMDCDYDPATAKEQLQKELIENTRGRRGRKSRRNRFREMIEAKKPIFNPEDEKTYSEYIDEYYKMDCEDFIGDIPCRFKYVETTPNDFGLTIEEILLAKNKELNQWASLKKAIQIRPEHLEKKDQRLYKLKAKNEELKRKIFKSLYGERSDDEDENEGGKEETLTGKVNIGETPALASTQLNGSVAKTDVKKSKKKRKRKLHTTLAQNDNNVTESIVETRANESQTPAKRSCLEEANGEKHEANVSIAPAATLQRNKKKMKKKANLKNGEMPQIQEDRSNKLANSVELKTKSKISSASKGNSRKKHKFVGTLARTSKPDHRDVESKGKPKFNKHKKKDLSNKSLNEKDAHISDERLKAYGINPKKFHKKQKYEINQKQSKNHKD